MARLGYKCDDCGSEHRGRDPAAFIDGDELCAGCYEDRMED
jgi:formylmethanofuran dehydrogenase subunit E